MYVKLYRKGGAALNDSNIFFDLGSTILLLLLI